MNIPVSRVSPTTALNMKPANFLDLPREIRQRILPNAAGFCNLRRETAQLMAHLSRDPAERHGIIRSSAKLIDNVVNSNPEHFEISKADVCKHADFHRLSCIHPAIRADMIYVESMWLTRDMPVDIFDLSSCKPYLD
ncbi:hypothetical protein MPH_04444 [Macrophomina phaseolina MS6]|uniref:Uncharacterized protein n=1 Tax=Macrophomina phaseolina (strain MS6) TaxID=1126212 RepID=K2S002_MACPH|nr:hypothetical protein MPH_04444 [Macrophomina phaseolina MS6]